MSECCGGETGAGVRGGMVCYCFGYTAEEIVAEFKAAGVSGIRARIFAETKAGNCRCAELNPAGRCCLGDVGAVIAACKS